MPASRPPSPLLRSEKSECRKAKRYFSNTCRFFDFFMKRKKMTETFSRSSFPRRLISNIAEIYRGTWRYVRMSSHVQNPPCKKFLLIFYPPGTSHASLISMNKWIMTAVNFSGTRSFRFGQRRVFFEAHSDGVFEKSSLKNTLLTYNSTFTLNHLNFVVMIRENIFDKIFFSSYFFIIGEGNIMAPHLYFIQ